jgi:hypothetical protein
VVGETAGARRTEMCQRDLASTAHGHEFRIGLGHDHREGLAVLRSLRIEHLDGVGPASQTRDVRRDGELAHAIAARMVVVVGFRLLNDECAVLPYLQCSAK